MILTALDCFDLTLTIIVTSRGRHMEPKIGTAEPEKLSNLPSLEYATCVWDPHTQIAKQKLEAVQRRAARYVTRRYHNTSSVTNMLCHLEWQTLEQRRIATNLTMLYKITNNIVTVPIHTYLTPWTRPPTRSHNLCYMPYQCNTNTLKYSFFPRTIILWNSLPSHIASAPTLNLFKDAVFTWTNTTTAAAV